MVASGKNHPPPWRKINFPCFFREKGRTIMFRLVSALFPGKGAENWFSALRLFGPPPLPHLNLFCCHPTKSPPLPPIFCAPPPLDFFDLPIFFWQLYSLLSFPTIWELRIDFPPGRKAEGGFYPRPKMVPEKSRFCTKRRDYTVLKPFMLFVSLTPFLWK